MKKICLMGLGLMSLAGLVSCGVGSSSEIAGVYGFDSIQIESNGEKKTIKKGETFSGVKLDEDFVKFTLYANNKFETNSYLTDCIQIGTWSNEDDKITLSYEITNNSETVTKSGNNLKFYEGSEGNSTTISLKRLSDSPDKGVEDYHYHSYNSDYSYDDDYHWYEPACSHNLYVAKNGHEWENEKCKVCHISIYSFSLDSDQNYQISDILEKSTFSFSNEKKHTIPESYDEHNVTSFNANIFDFSDTEELYFGKNIKKIVGSFSRASSLKSIYFDGTVNDFVNIEFEDYDANPLYYAENFYVKNNDKYENVEEITIPDTVTRIKERQYACFRDLTKVYMSKNTSIAYDAFYGCDKLSSVYFDGTKEEYMTKIGQTVISSTNRNIDIYVYENGAWIILEY
mgnify:CR=1 FL=1